MKNWYTVAPLHTLVLEPNARFDFGGGLELAALPDWLRRDRACERLSEFDKRVLASTTFAFIAQYDAEALYSPDPTWTGSTRKSIQQRKYESMVLANLALWLSRPSGVGFFTVFHAPVWGDQPAVQSVERHAPLLCHPADINASPSPEDIRLAAALYQALASLRKDNALWTAVRASWHALSMNVEEVRYLLLWVALEALFGPEDSREITFRMSLRIAFFLATSPVEARTLFIAAKKGYTFRSKVAHGRWKENPEAIALVAELESFVRRSMVRILQEPEFMKMFLSGDREHYLDSLAFSQSQEEVKSLTFWEPLPRINPQPSCAYCTRSDASGTKSTIRRSR
jgi:hypothetical protein